jgi:hypothetical protein
VGVLQRGRGVRLAQEAVDRRALQREVRLEDLERDAPAARLLERLVDDAHPAAADLPDDPEVAELAPFGW